MNDFIPRPLSMVRFKLPVSFNSSVSGCQTPTSPPPPPPPLTTTTTTTTTTTKTSGVSAIGILSRAARGTGDVALSLWDGLSAEERSQRRAVEERKGALCLAMKNAKTLKDWESAAQELDVLEGNNKWRQDPAKGDYNVELIEARLRDLDEARASGDVRAMMHLIRTALSRDLGGMGNVDLYRHSYVGTKELIERYVESAIQTIESLVHESAKSVTDSPSDHDLLECVLLARQSFGRSALLLSGGATFGMVHIGVLKTLFEAKLLPRLISGTSAGSIVCAVLCTRTDAEIPDLIREFPYGDLDVFAEKGGQNGLLSHLQRLLTEGSWSDISNLIRVMRGLVGDITFQEAYNRTRRILNITVSTESMYELPRLLNYITAPNVMIWSAVAASCSVPLVFSAAPLLVKNPVTGEHLPWNPTPQKWIDGSVDNDLPMTRLAEMFNVNHFIVSQVNPHVVPFLAKDDHLEPGSSRYGKEETKAAGEGADWVSMMTSLAKDEALHRMHFLAELGIFPTLITKLRSILSQRYSGDINILPGINVQDLPKILANPTSDFMLRSCLAGERATWPKMTRIRDRCAIELALDRAAHALRARVVFSSSQVDLRRLAAGIVYQPWTRAGASQAAHEAAKGGYGTGGDFSRTAHRRGSGSSIQMLAHHRRMMLENRVTDEETEEEELSDMLNRSGHALRLTPLTRKPRLKRAAKSQFDVLNLGPLTGPSCPSGDGTSGFDFSRPVYTRHHSDSVLSGNDGDRDNDEDEEDEEDEEEVGEEGEEEKEAETKEEHAPLEDSTLVQFPEPGYPVPRGTITSPTDDPETTDLHSSDGDVESGTEESVSDPEPYDRASRQPRPDDHDHDHDQDQKQDPLTVPEAGESSQRKGDIPDPSDGSLWE